MLDALILVGIRCRHFLALANPTDAFSPLADFSPMNTPTSQQAAARDFAAFWTDKEYEKGQTQP